MGAIVLEIVTPSGRELLLRGLDAVVFRRHEEGREQGSEIAVLPRHGPLLSEVCAHELRYRAAGVVGHVAVGPGVAEVLDDTVTLLVEEARAVPGARA